MEEELRIIDEILPFVRRGEIITLMDLEDVELYPLAIARARAFDVIGVNPDKTLFLTRRGHEALDAGGFKKWLDEKRQREDAVHLATVDSSTSAKRSAYAAYVSAAIAGVALVIAGLTYWQGTKPDPEIERLQDQIDSLRTRLQVNAHREVKPARIKPGSLGQ
ncbi:hypothetical protein [Fibrella aestuarina]|uniref:hypothetical protein n=1 Tax=Fibrella aestuarina TaxID=651143 RepID=UPI00059EA532|nr:hypothetical protein [Fibrella aestuarina]